MNAPANLPAPTNAPPANWQEGLTGKMVVFVEHYVRWRNATQAYDHAFEARGGSYETRRNEGHRILNRPEVQRAIALRAKVATDVSGYDVAWLLQRFLAMATADPRELLGLKVGCCRYCYGDEHRYQWREREFIEAMEKVEWEARCFPERAATMQYPDPAGGFGFNATWPPRADCPQCHGEGLERFVPRDTDQLSEQALLLYGGVKVKKDGGYEIIMADRAKAAELAGRILGAFNDKVKISGTLGHLHAIADLRKVDPQEAARVYREMIANHLTA